MQRWLGLAPVAMVAVALVGCGSQGDRPDLGRVTGVVTLDGRPVEEARISFNPAAGGRTSLGVTNAEGEYTLYYDVEEGAKVGSHTVSITTFSESGDGLPGRAEELPRKYNYETELTAEVEPGKQTIDFVLEDVPGEKKRQPMKGRRAED